MASLDTTLKRGEVLRHVNIRVKVPRLFGPLGWRRRLGVRVLQVGVWLASRILRVSIRVEYRNRLGEEVYGVRLRDRDGRPVG